MDTLHRVKVLPTRVGKFAGFNSQPVSHDEKKYLLIEHGETTQHGMRAADELPQIVVVDIDTGKEQCRLMGHKDAIMWAGWSLDDKIIASACWDETYRLWDSETGECRHVIDGTGGQNWAGIFLPDGKHVVLSGGQPVKVGVYDIYTGCEVITLNSPAEIRLDHWMRYFTVHPTRNLVVLQNARTLLAWEPFASPDSQMQQIFAMTKDTDPLKNHYGAIFTIKWADEGRKLLAQGSDSTTFVWDMEKGQKWRFQRPKGRELSIHEGDVFFVRRDGSEWVLSLDQDGKVRCWKL